MRSFLFIGFILFFGYSYTQTTGTMTDSRDGKIYKTVVIGTQTWLAENLNVDKFRNGDPIPEAKTNEEWLRSCENKQPAWCYYDNEPINGNKYGKLYNWYAVNDPRGLSPKGWHIPTDAEFAILTKYLGDEDEARTKLKCSIGWETFNGVSGNGNDSSGFSGHPGGMCNGRNVCGGMGFGGYWWSSSEVDIYNASWLTLFCTNLYPLTHSFSDIISFGLNNKSFCLSVRGIKD